MLSLVINSIHLATSHNESAEVTMGEECTKHNQFISLGPEELVVGEGNVANSESKMAFKSIGSKALYSTWP